MSPQEAIDEVPEQKALALIDRLQPPRPVLAQSAWTFGWINVEPDEFNERSGE